MARGKSDKNMDRGRVYSWLKSSGSLRVAPRGDTLYASSMWPRNGLP